ncbi:basic proline-rich protein-like [Lepus europaeus]|uniref:basic proline-rich protein-like n=1 Tax=Lepus europaeus TaxID=9983 RepID=UPI002B48B819|nr:basic proline-rich protein-like [Lepus europaeus]
MLGICPSPAQPSPAPASTAAILAGAAEAPSSGDNGSRRRPRLPTPRHPGSGSFLRPRCPGRPGRGPPAFPGRIRPPGAHKSPPPTPALRSPHSSGLPGARGVTPQLQRGERGHRGEPSHNKGIPRRPPTLPPAARRQRAPATFPAAAARGRPHAPRALPPRRPRRPALPGAPSPPSPKAPAPVRPALGEPLSHARGARPGLAHHPAALPGRRPHTPGSHTGTLAWAADSHTPRTPGNTPQGSPCRTRGP